MSWVKHGDVAHKVGRFEAQPCRYGRPHPRHTSARLKPVEAWGIVS